MGNSSSYHPNKTIKSFYIQHYLGDWYEIAKYPLIYQKDCISSSASYTWDQNNHRINVVNTCYQSDGTSRNRKGIAWIPNHQDPGKLKLQFTDSGLNSGYISDYYIHWTDYCHFSIVGSPCKKYLWFLSRKPQITLCDFKFLCSKAREFSYDTSKLTYNPNVITQCNLCAY